MWLGGVGAPLTAKERSAALIPSTLHTYFGIAYRVIPGR